MDPFEQNPYISLLTTATAAVVASTVVTTPALASEVPRLWASWSADADAALAEAPSRGSPQQLSGLISLGSPV